MSVRIVIVNTLSDSTIVAIGNRRVAILSMGWLQETVRIGATLPGSERAIAHNGRAGNVGGEGGPYTVIPGRQGDGSPVKEVVDRILDQQCVTYGWCQPEMPGQSPCEY